MQSPRSSLLPACAQVLLLLLCQASVSGQSPAWQVNQPLAHMDIKGLSNSATSGPILVYAEVGEAVTLNFSSSSTGSPYDICATPSSAVPSVWTTPQGQFLNLNFSHPQFACFNNLFQASMPAGLQSATVTVTSPLLLSAQMVVITPGHPDGFAFSAPCELRVASYCAQPAIIEDFSSTVNRADVGGYIQWNGNGELAATFPFDLLGDGSDGAVVFTAAGSPHLIDIDTIPPGSPGYQGVWNATSILVEAGAQVTFKGSWPVHFKSQDTVTIGAGSSIIGNAILPDSGIDGPWKGGINNNSPTPGGAGNSIVFGGKPGPGGGRGGDASQAGNPSRTLQAASGEGPSVNGLPGNVPSDPGYGPGQGGQGAQHVQLIIGTGGGAGGSAYGRGGDGVPLNGVNSSGGCSTPLAVPQVTPALAFGFPVGFIPPVSTLSGGSGGGGGGDRFDLVTPSLNLNDQGGGGGGGGGGFRVSSAENIVLQPGAHIEMNGSPGNACASLGAGAGGSGSGGMIWLQTFADLIIDPNANMQVHGGTCPAGPTGLLNYRCAGAPGLGGEGLYQLEDSDGIVNVSFQGSSAQQPSSCGTNQTSPVPPLPMQGPNQNIAVLQFPFSGTVQGDAQSHWFDTGFPAPKFVVPAAGDEQFTLGNVPGGFVVIEYQGTHEDPANPGSPSSLPAAWTAWAGGAGISALDGNRFVRFRVSIGYTAPPVSNAAHILPAVQEIRINFRTPQNCP